MSTYSAFLLPTRKMLHNLDLWLAKAIHYSEARGFDVNLLLTSRLAPDQYPLAKQVQAACDAAKLGAARLSGKTAPVHTDTEATVEELRARVAAVVTWMDTLTAEDFAGCDTRDIHLPFAAGKVMQGRDYVMEMALPNFYFHTCMAYAILRHNGVELGKRDYIGPLTMRDAG